MYQIIYAESMYIIGNAFTEHFIRTKVINNDITYDYFESTVFWSDKTICQSLFLLVFPFYFWGRYVKVKLQFIHKQECSLIHFQNMQIDTGIRNRHVKIQNIKRQTCLFSSLIPLYIKTINMFILQNKRIPCHETK